MCTISLIKPQYQMIVVFTAAYQLKLLSQQSLSRPETLNILNSVSVGTVCRVKSYNKK